MQDSENYRNLVKGLDKFLPSDREAALLASLDESPIKKYDPNASFKTGTVGKEDIAAESKPESIDNVESAPVVEEPVVEEVVKESTSEAEEKVSEVNAKPEESTSEPEAVETKEETEPLSEEQPIEETVEPVAETPNESLEDKEPVAEESTSAVEEEKQEEPASDEHPVAVVEEKESLSENQVDVEEESAPIVEGSTTDESTGESDEDLTEEEKEKRRQLKIRGSISEDVGETENSKVPGKFEVFPEDDQFKYRLKANNGEILVVSYGYTTRDGAHSGIDTLKKNLEEGKVTYITDKNGRSQWRLSTSNDSRIVAVGETYSSLANAQSAFTSTQKFGKTTKIVDLDEIPDSEKREWHFTCDEVVEKDTGSIEIYDDSGKFRARLLANNQEVLFVTAQSYSTKASLKSALDNIKEKLNKDSFHVSKDKQGRYQFIMESGSGFVYLIGESYSTKAASISAAGSVLAFIRKAEIHDLTLKSSDVDVTLTGVKKSEAE